MKKISLPLILITVNLAAVGFVVVRFLTLCYPMVGHDYSLAVPSMLDTYLHYRVSGLSVQWYTPTFGGGLPAFPDPNNGQFSLLVLLTLLGSPWQAVMVSSIVYIALGGIAIYYLFARILRLHWTSSILGMVFFSANGFMMQRVAVGHLGFCAFPVIVILFVLLLDPAINRGIAGLGFSFVVALLVYEAGYFLIVVFGLAILIVLPLIYIFRLSLFSWKRTLTVLAMGATIALVLSASKLAAVYAFMRFFPRQMADSYNVGVGKGLVGILFQLLGTMNLAPMMKVVGLHPSHLTELMINVSGATYGYWEFDMSLSPVVFGLVLLGFYNLVRRPKKHVHLFKPNKKWLAWIFLLMAIWIVAEFILGKGLIYPYLERLPILSSLHVNPRFTAAFIFPLAMCAALAYDAWSKKWPARKATLIFLAVNVLTLLPLATYFMIHRDLQDREYDITESFAIYDAIRAGNPMEITGINADLSNTQALAQHESNLHPYDPIFGYQLESFHPEIHPGSVWMVTDGYYNMTNPTGYVFPEVNGTRPFERIKTSDEKNLEAFVEHRQPAWKIPLYQHILNWISGLTFVVVAGTLIFVGFRRLEGHFLRQRNSVLRGL